jgi:hypothetical protein
MTDDEQKALAWLDQWVNRGSFVTDQRIGRTLQAMLASPRLPATPTPDAFDHIRFVLRDNDVQLGPAAFAVVWRTIHAHLAGDKPAPPAEPAPPRSISGISITFEQGEQIIAALGEMRDLLSRCLDDIGDRK